VLFLILKAIASVLAAWYGVYATVTDFHEKRDGIERLSKAGKQGISFLVMVSLFGICVDVWKEWHEHENEAAGQESTKQTAAKLENVLLEARRAGDPIEQDFKLTFGFRVDGDQSIVRHYIHRVAKSTEHDFHFDEFSAKFPVANIKSEASLSELAHFDGIDINFYKGAVDTSSGGLFSLHFDCSGHKKLDIVRPGINGQRTIYIECEVDTTGMPTKDFQSYRDMDGSNVFIQVSTKEGKQKEDPDAAKNDFNISFKAPEGEELKDFDFEPSIGRLLSKKRRLCELSDPNRISCGESPGLNILACYSAKVKCD